MNANIHVNATELSCSDRGQGNAVVLLHGFPLDRSMWDAQVRNLGSDWRVIVPDLRGFGQSVSKLPFTIESLADDVHALVEKLGVRPCVFGGLSMGGYVALAYAKKYPTDLCGLMLLDTRAEADAPQARDNREKMIELVRAQGSAAVADEMLGRVLAASTREGRPALVARVRAIMTACPAMTIEHALEAMRDRPDLRDSLASIPVPTLVVVGQHDQGTPPPVMEAMSKAIPQAQFVVIPDAGHLSPLEQPRHVNRAIRRYLAVVKSR